jgi:predicted permease
MLGKNPGFTAIAVLTLALGIGANTAIFSVYNSIALRPFAVRDGDRVVSLLRTQRDFRGRGVFSYPDYEDVRQSSTVFTGLVAYAESRMVMSGNQTGDGGRTTPETVKVMLVSGNYFSVLGGEPALGRTFRPEEDRQGNPQPVVVLSDRFWRQKLAGNPDLIGKTLTLNDATYTVVGVAPASFLGVSMAVPDLWVPLAMTSNVIPGRGLLQGRDNGWLRVVGRLKPGISLPRAQAEMEVIAQHLQQAEKDTQAHSGLQVVPGHLLDPRESENVTAFAFLVMAAVGLLLLIACGNVANLLLARSAVRQKEFGLRVALGAGRARLLRQLLTENVMLALAGGAAGLILAGWAATFLVAVIHPPGDQAMSLDLSPDIRILGYTLGISLLTAVIFGTAPALQVSRQNPLGALREEVATFGTRLSRGRLRSILVAGQVAMSLFLLVAAGLLVRALQKAQGADPGFETKDLLVASPDLNAHGYDAAASYAFGREALVRIEGLPGVRSAAVAANAPLGTNFAISTIVVEGREPASGARLPEVDFNMVTPGFFNTLGISILRGRTFTELEFAGKARVAVINQSMAQRFWPGEDPVGKLFHQGRKSAPIEVIGVAKDTRSVYLWANHDPYFYLPLTPGETHEISFLVKTMGSSPGIARAIEDKVRGADGRLQVQVTRLDENLSNWVWPSRLGAEASSALGLLALLLASAGIYGIAAYAASQRTREFGIRLALGAQPRDIVRLMLGQGLRVAALGGAVGLVASIILSSVVSKFLYGLSALDALAFVGAILLLGVVVAAACWIPARRAMRVDPMVALRYE